MNSYYGLLQAFADALKLLLKEYVAPTQANIILFFLGPVITLIFALLGYGVIPYGPGLTINDLNLGIYYMLAVSSLATYGILLAGFYFIKSPLFVQTNKYNPIEFQENLNMRQLEAKPTLYTNLSLKYERSTTSRLLKELIILPRVIGILNSFLIVPFLRTIYIWPNKAWLNFHNTYLLFLCHFACFTSLMLTFICILFNKVLSFISHTNKPLMLNWNIRSKLSEVKLNTSIFAYTSDSLSYNNKFKRFYSTKSNYSGDLLSKDEFNLDKENLDNSNKDFNFEEDLRALHYLYVKDLFKDRIAPVIPFDSNLILASFNLSDIKERSGFLKEWGSKGGIYLIEYKYNPLVYYIGRTTLFKRRINNHIKAETTSKFHAFLNLIGLEHFKFSIVEISSPSEQGKRENYYLQKFLPLLNTTFSSSFSESAIYMSLTDKLTSLKSTTLGLLRLHARTQKSNQPIPIFTYTLCKDKGINPTYIKYNNISEASTKEKIAYGTVLLFRDTNVPFRGKLYFTKSIIDFNSTLDLVNNTLKDVKIISNVAQKVWAYDALTLN
jgi:NADH dehydrogenase/GIY-YIG catalytic domain